MEENRRGFLKTLGKLGVALGITTAACSAHHHGHHGEHHPPKAKPHTTPKATIGTVPKDALLNFQPNGNVIRTPITHASNVCITNRDKLRGGLDWGQGEATAEAQKAIDAINNLRLDNITQQMNPDMMVVPPHMYDFMRAKEAVRELDPYNWGKVFDLKWQDWKARDPRHATVTGVWIATVKPQFYGVVGFDDGKQSYHQSQSIAMEYLVSAAQDPDRIKKVAKEQCYRQLVDKLQDVILERIKRDVKANA